MFNSSPPGSIVAPESLLIKQQHRGLFKLVFMQKRVTGKHNQSNDSAIADEAVFTREWSHSELEI